MGNSDGSSDVCSSDLFALQMNSEDYPVLRGVMNELLDHYLGFPERDWVAAFGEWNDKRLAGGVAALDAATAGEHEHTTPSLPLAQYAARYVDNWYGDRMSTRLNSSH